MTIGKEIRERRRAAGTSQQSLAEAAGLHFVTLSRIECGHAVPTLQTLTRIAEALQCDVSALINCDHSSVTPEVTANTPAA